MYVKYHISEGQGNAKYLTTLLGRMYDICRMQYGMDLPIK